MVKRHFVIPLAVLVLAALVACDRGGEVTPTPEVTVAPTATGTATPTPRPTTGPPDQSVVFCETEDDGRVGYLRYLAPAPSQCTSNGFVLDQLPAGTAVAVGEFVPACFQPSGDDGFRLIVGTRCVQDGPTRVFTTDPRPSELRDRLNDGDLIPFCAFETSDYPDYPITVGPPCILGGEGYTSITLDLAEIEAAANCTASFTYMGQSESQLRALLQEYPDAGATDLSDAHTAIATAIEALSEVPPERVQRYFAPWGENSPIERNAEIVDALEGLNGDVAVEVVEATRTLIQDAIDWYSAGRGC
ncbi:MAG: hypothetical protein O3A10_00490 [Chloroflexi bacterium]|nr:hypothetical protein [Chloroflexota bacterium]MDA1145435.1 hypothetical protein [Chloroflexota bacterium]